MISLDLLTQIIGKESLNCYDGTLYISPIIRIKVEESSILYNFDDGCINRTSIMYDGSINFDDLIEKCKEYATLNSNEIYIDRGEDFVEVHILKNGRQSFIKKSTELESIIKACEWIIEQQK